MRITNKLNRPTSIVAAIFLLLVLLLSTMAIVITQIRAGAQGNVSAVAESVFWNGLNFIVTLLVIIALFRGKKDIFSAVVFILAALQPTAQLLVGFSRAENMEYWSELAKLSQYCNYFAHLTNLAFRILVVVECFKPGALSGGMRRLLLIFLPIIWLLVSNFAVGLQNLSYAFSDPTEAALAIFPVVFISVLLSMPWVVVGIAFSIPVREPVRPPVPQPPFIPGVPPVFPPHF
jgi:hypothetical protein